MAGPQRARLDTALSGAFEDVVADHSYEWKTCVGTMMTISRALQAASPEMKAQIGGETGPAIDRAFAKSAQGMQAKAEDLIRGSSALQAAAGVIREARQEQADLDSDQRSKPGEYHPPVGQPTKKDLEEEAQNKQAHAAYNAWYADQERRAQAQADRMDKVFGHSTQVMKDIHGIPDPEPPTGDPGGPSGGRGGGSIPTPAHGSGGPAGGTGPRSPQPPTPYDPPGPNGGKPGPGYVPADPGPGYVPGGGSGPQGGSTLPIDYTPGGGGSVGSIGSGASPGSGGLTGSTGAGVAGAAAGGLGGLLASNLAGGGIRGGLGGSVVASPGTAASGVRGIGASGRTGISGALGKPGVSAVSPGGGAATAGRGASASSRAAGTRGAGGSAAGRGSRSSAAGGGTAAGRAGNRKDDEKRRKHDLFDASEDWVDDEDAAPSVID